MVVVVVALVAGSAVALAAPGGMPAAHGVDGKTFGGVVSAVAQANPIALAEHVGGCYTP